MVVRFRSKRGRNREARAFFRGELISPRVQHLELLSEMRRVQQLHQSQLSLAKSAGFCAGSSGDEVSGIANKERLLGFNDRRRKAVSLQCLDKPVPTNVAGKILFT